ncbi:MAG: Ig-like domain-containing protein [bacterium]
MNKIIKIITKYWKYLALGLLLIVASSTLFNSPPKLTSANPTNGQIEVDLNSDVILTFNKKVQPTNFEFRSTPEETFIASKDNSNTVTLSHTKSFYQATQYAVDVYYNKQKISTISFTTQQSQSNPRDLQKIQEGVDRDYPLADKLPFTTPTYQVVYISALTLQVELYDETLDQPKITKEINNWIGSEGVDPSTHTLVFKLPTHPSPTTMR